MSRSKLQKLTPGQDAEATDIEFDKNALIVDTIVLARNYMHDLHRVQNDFEVMGSLAADQAGLMREHEDGMILQQVLTGALTGGAYNWQTSAITGGTKRLKDHGVAIKTVISPAQAVDPYTMAAALEVTVEGMLSQKTPLKSMVIQVPLQTFSILRSYGYVAMGQGGTNSMASAATSTISGTLAPFGIPIHASVKYTDMIRAGAHSSLLSNENNGNRYDFTADMALTKAVIYSDKALMVGQTLGMESDVYYDKKTKGNFIDTWMSNGAIPDRYDNIGCVIAKGGDNATIKAKADAAIVKMRTLNPL